MSQDLDDLPLFAWARSRPIATVTDLRVVLIQNAIAGRWDIPTYPQPATVLPMLRPGRKAS